MGSGLQAKLQAHFEKNQEQLCSWKKKEAALKQRIRELEDGKKENSQLKEKLREAEAGRSRRRYSTTSRRRRHSPMEMSPEYSSDEMSDVSVISSRDYVMQKNVGRRMSAMRQQLSEMNDDRHRVLDSLLTTPSYTPSYTGG